MARIRTIKPEFWTDEKLSECSLSARLLFIGLISFVDDEGRMEYAPARVRMQVFPCGSVPQGVLIELVGELHEHSLIRLYTLNDKEYLDIPGFLKHQKINRPTPSKLPPFSESSVSPLAGMERKGMERKGSKTRARAREVVDNPVPGLDEAAWSRWSQYRKATGKPIRSASQHAARKKLAALGDGQAAAVENSIANGYQGLFGARGSANGTHQQGSTAYERSRQKLERWATEQGVDPKTI